LAEHLLRIQHHQISGAAGNRTIDQPLAQVLLDTGAVGGRGDHNRRLIGGEAVAQEFRNSCEEAVVARVELDGVMMVVRGCSRSHGEQHSTGRS
jgi:hypothetical protein